MRRISIIDTSILCVWLDVPGKETCGPQSDLWDKSRVNRTINHETEQGALFVLPLAVIIETGNHIAQSSNAWECANSLCDVVKKTLDKESPWATFTQQDALWSGEILNKLVTEWPDYAKSGLSIGDMTIKTVADFYAESGYSVQILTGDVMLKAYEPVKGLPVPRRHKR